MFRSVEGRAHGIVGFGPIDRTVVMGCFGAGAALSSVIVGALAALLVAGLLIALRRADGGRREHLLIAWRRRWGDRRYDPSRPDEGYLMPARSMAEPLTDEQLADE